MSNIANIDNSNFSLLFFARLCDDGSSFWNSSLSWNTKKPILSACFIDTALSYPPIIYLWLFSIFSYIIHQYDNRENFRNSIKFNFYNSTKLVAAIALLVVGLIDAIQIVQHWLNQNMETSLDFVSKARLLSVCLTSVTYLLFIFNLHFQRKHGFINSGANWLYLLLLLVFNTLAIFFSQDYRSKDRMIYIYIQYSLQIFLFLLCSFPERVANIEQLVFSANENDQLSWKSFQINNEKNFKLNKTNICPKETASVPSKLTFWWFNALIFKGWKRPLTEEDLWDLPVWNRSSYLFQEFNKLWKHGSFCNNLARETSNQSRNRSLNLWIVFVKLFLFYFLLPSFARLATDLLQLANPIVLKFMISFITDKDSPLWQGIFFSCIFSLTSIFQSLSSAYQQHRMAVLSLRIHAILISAIYRKSLVLAMHSKKSYSTGEIVNLMAVDAKRFTELVPWISYLWAAPLQISFGLWLLWQELEWSVVGGLVLMLATIPLNSFIANFVKKIQRKQMLLKDKRLKAISEMLNGIHVLKMYAWEDAFVKNICNIRLNELKYIKRSGLISTVFIAFGSCSPFLVSMLTFSLYVFVAGGTLTAEKAFVSISLFNLLRLPLIMIPNVFSGLILTIVSMKRINNFLNQDETSNYIERISIEKNAVEMTQASLSWNNIVSNDSFTLNNLTVKIPKNKLIAVVGPVGSGKSSFLYALLGEMNKYGGNIKIDIDQRLAFVPQQAWIQNLTLRDNILFGQLYDKEKYDKVVKACALKTDFSMLDGGDQTEIGEKGINLSGGQKQRVSIARSCYSDSNMFLFDDPLSAIDSHVGKHIFNEVLSNESGMLRNKTRILVTNALYVLPRVDEIILIKNGTINDIGSYTELLNRNPNFQELIHNFNQVNLDDNSSKNYEKDNNNIIKEDESFESQNSQKIFAETKLITEMKDLTRSISNFDQSRGQLSRKNTDQLSATGLATVVGKTEAMGKLVDKESVETGQISFVIYKKFISAISFKWSIIIISCYIGNTVASVGSNFWISIWTNSEDKDSNSTRYIVIYFVIGLCQVILVILGWMSIVSGTMNATRKLHSKLLYNIIHAPMYFFNTTPLGRIINRFSKDIDILDNYIQLILRIILNTTLTVLSTLLVVSMKTPIFIAIVVPFIVLYFFIQRFYVSTSRQLKRIESVSRSPMFTHFAETIQGVSSIKAYGAADSFIREMNRRVDHNQRCFYPSQVANCWLQIRLEFLANCLLFFSSFIATMTRDDLNGSSIGLSLSYALNITLPLNMCVRMFAELENNVVSVERISEYTDVKSEAKWYTDFDIHLADEWPKRGEIKFTDYSTRYRPGLDLVLKNINILIKPGEKIGIVGRTGAGKSSLTQGLFRIIESSQGLISIDNVNISFLGLHKLRSCLTIIPQDPVLFCGTIRFNLDPFEQYSDEQLWTVLELSHLKTFVMGLDNRLQYIITEAGENISVGQRQLICLARALLRRTKILVLDEATASVDLETDALIQATIRQEFLDCTVLTIAHRLHTILDSDRVLVLDAGKVAEFDSPKTLLANNQTIFHCLAKDSGIIKHQ